MSLYKSSMLLMSLFNCSISNPSAPMKKIKDMHCLYTRAKIMAVQYTLLIFMVKELTENDRKCKSYRAAIVKDVLRYRINKAY